MYLNKRDILGGLIPFRRGVMSYRKMRRNASRCRNDTAYTADSIWNTCYTNTKCIWYVRTTFCYLIFKNWKLYTVPVLKATNETISPNQSNKIIIKNKH